jgi:hypothetical protein
VSASSPRVVGVDGSSEGPLMRVFRTHEGAVLVEVRGMRAVTTVGIGKLDAPLVHQMLSLYDRWLSLADHGLVAFHDLEGVTDQEAGGVTELLRWLLPHQTRFAAIHFLLRSPVARAHVGAGNLDFGGILQAHGDRAEFERHLALQRGGEGAAERGKRA